MSGLNPYAEMSASRFWRTAIAERDFLDLDDLWSPAYDISPEDKVVTAGSCFAQHIGRALARNGYGWTDFEPAPPLLDPEAAKAFNYGIFSFRTGNIYTTQQLLQWLRWARNKEPAPEEVWEKDGRFFDPFRPQIEPGGFASADEMFAARDNTLRAFNRAFRQADIFVFTLGLTEMWVDAETGLSYPTCPGTIAGTFDPDRHKFKNLTYPEIYKQLKTVIRIASNINPTMKFLLTVSPVPLTATAADKHVLVSTTYSKSVLRAVAGDLAEEYDHVDYFPSYEIISSAPSQARFYEPNMRSVHPDGVSFVMSQFFRGLGVAQRDPVEMTTLPNDEQLRARLVQSRDEDDLVCEEQVLEAYNAN